MFRVLLRELLIAVGALAALALAALVVAYGYGAPAWPDWPVLWVGLTRGDPVAVGTALRLGTYALLALLAGLIVLRMAIAALLLKGLDYAFLAHLGAALRLPEVRRAGAATAVGLMLGPAGILGAAGPPDGRHVPGPSAGITAPRRRGSGRMDDGVPQRGKRTGARMPRRQVVKRVGLALLYTVQPGDTLTLIAERLYGDWRQYTRILQASQTTVQPDGQRLTNPNRIYPGWTLRVPLPVPAVSVVGDHAIYIVQPGDTLSQIAARFLGGWRRYTEIDRLSRGVHQPAGGLLQDDNLIQPGRVLRLPAARVIAPYTRPARLTRIRPRPEARRHRAASPPIAGVVGIARTHYVGSPAQGRTHPPACGVVSLPRQVSVALPRQAAVHRAYQHTPPRQIHAHPMRPLPRLRPKRHGRVRLTAHHPRRQTARRHVSAAHPVAPGQVLPPAATHRQGARPEISARRSRAGSHPVVCLPDSGRTLPLTLAVAVLALCSMAVMKVKRGAVPVRAAMRLAPSMQRALVALQGGVRGRLETALRRAGAATRPQTGNGVAHVLAALDQAGGDAGLPVHLAKLTRAVTETPETVSLLVEARRLSDEALERVVTALQRSLGSPVHLERVMGSDGMPCIRATLKRPSIMAPRPVSPHPAPLLVPLGHTAERVVHVNLGRLGALLVAGGAQGSNTLVATLLASTVAQAAPTEVRLLVASRDDDLRAMLPVLEHLEAPPADAGDVTATAALLEQVHRVVLERFARGDDGPKEPAYLVVLDTVETLCSDPRALDRLDVICRNGRACGVQVLATTSEPAALAAAGMLEPFGARLARTLRAEGSALVCGDERAVTLGLKEIVFREGPLGTWKQMSPFVLTLPEVREVFAAVAVAQAPDPPEQEPVGPTSQGDMVSDQQDTLPDTGVTTAGTPATAMSAGEQNGVPVAPDAGGPEDESTDEDCAVPTQQDDEEGSTLTASTAVEVTQPEVTPNAADRRVEVRVLGTIVAFVHGRPVEIQPREQRVLAALAIMGPKPVRADRLVEAVFADDDPDSGHGKLRHAIGDLRAALRKAGLPAAGAKAVVGRTSAGYYLDATLARVDAYLFSDLLARSRTAPRAERGHLLAQVVELYAGDLCGDQAQTWVDDWSYGWRKDYLQALYELALYREKEEHDLLGALRLARRLVAEEPLTDRYHQMVMELLATQGDNDGVAQQYQAYRAEMEEAGLEIDPDIHALYQRLRTKAG